MISSPYLLYLGSATDDLSVKTAIGVAAWRPELCIGEFQSEGCTVTLNLPRMDFEQAAAAGVQTVVLGVTNAGGVMNPQLIEHILEAIRAGLNVASGLHQRLRTHPTIAKEAALKGVELHDLRHPPEDLGVGTGVPRRGLRMLTVGTDCSVGKMYATLAVEREMHSRNIKANFRATGQTGILIAQSGIAVDAVVADFISGAAERLSPARDDDGWDLIEGQGSLFHPSFAGVSLGLLHGSQPDAIVLCHAPERPHMRGIASRALPSLQDCLNANLEAGRLTNPDIVAAGVAVNTSRLDPEQRQRCFDSIEDLLNLPCEDPVATGVKKITDNLIKCVDKSKAA